MNGLNPNEPMRSHTSALLPTLGSVWLAALLLAVATLLLLELWGRSLGMSAGLIDSKQLWSLQRDRIYGDHPRPVVFIGASRSAYGIDPKTWQSLVPDTKPIMLSINGRHPIAVLRDLAADPEFRGLVICDVDTHGLLRRWWDMQQDYVDHYHRRWNWNWRIHRLLLNVWQRISVLANPALSWKAALQRWVEGGRLTPPMLEIDSSRGGWILFDRFDNAAMAKFFDDDAERKMREPRPSVAEFLADARQIRSWVRAIQQRGGEVIFFQPPVSGRVAALEREYFDRAAYWDAFAALDGIRALHFDDVPAMARLALPDHSHVRAEDRSVLTRTLVEELRRRGWLDTTATQVR